MIARGWHASRHKQAGEAVCAGYRAMIAAAPAPVVPRKMDIPPPGVDALDVVYAEGWNAACDAFFGGLPPQPALVVEVSAAPDVREPLTDQQFTTSGTW